MILLLSQDLACARTTWIIAFGVIGFFGTKFINSATKYRKGSTHTRTLHAFTFNNFHWCRSFNWKIIHCPIYISSSMAWPSWPAEWHHPMLRFQLSLYLFYRNGRPLTVRCPYPSCSMHWPLAITRRMIFVRLLRVCFFSIEYIKFCRSNSAALPFNEIECHKK